MQVVRLEGLVRFDTCAALKGPVSNVRPVGEIVRSRREALGLSQEAAAWLAGVGKSTLRNIEADRVDEARTWNQVERAYGWAPGSLDRLRAGEDPRDLLPPEVIRILAKSIYQIAGSDIREEGDLWRNRYRQIMIELSSPTLGGVHVNGEVADSLIALTHSVGTLSEASVVESCLGRLTRKSERIDPFSFTPRGGFGGPVRSSGVLGAEAKRMARSFRTQGGRGSFPIGGAAPGFPAGAEATFKYYSEYREVADPERPGLWSPHQAKQVITITLPAHYDLLSEVEVSWIAGKVAEDAVSYIEAIALGKYLIQGSNTSEEGDQFEWENELLRVKEMRDSGLSLGDISRETGLPAKSIWEILKHESTLFRPPVESRSEDSDPGED